MDIIEYTWITTTSPSLIVQSKIVQTPNVLDIIWLHQLCKKFVKETIFNIWRNEKYFISFAYLWTVWLLLFGQNPIEIIVDKMFVLDFAKIVTKQLLNKQN